MELDIYKTFFRGKSYRRYRAQLFNLITALMIGGLILGFAMLVIYFVNNAR